MKYMILIHNNPHFHERWAKLSAAERGDFGRCHYALSDALAESGELIVSEGLADPSLAKRVTASDGQTMTTDGPFAEVKEHLAGFYLVDCDSQRVGAGDRGAGAGCGVGPGRGPPGAGPQPRGHVSGAGTTVEPLLRELAPQVLGVLVALTLRALGGLSTAAIARGLLLPEPTVAQRISRAKARIKAAGAQFRPPTDAERDRRLPAVMRVLYLIFNEGYTTSSGSALQRVDLTAEAIRLTCQLRQRLPGEGEVAGLLALMLLTDARRPARTRPDGAQPRPARSSCPRRDRATGRPGLHILMSLLSLELSCYYMNTVQLHVNAAEVLVRHGVDGEGSR